jgi:hypothetical protein
MQNQDDVVRTRCEGGEPLIAQSKTRTVAQSTEDGGTVIEATNRRVAGRIPNAGREW